MSKTWLITGASRGIGAEIAKAALTMGHNVAATARNITIIADSLGASKQLLAVELDVTNPTQIKTALNSVIQRFGKLDVLVNNAGYGQLGVFEESTPAEVQAAYSTNVFGLMDMTRAVIPYFRQQRSGHIFNISSIAGLKGNFGGSIYNSTKFAVEGFSQSIAEELIAFGIYVTAISPGFFRTDFLDEQSVNYSERSINDYDTVMHDYLNFLKNRNHNQLGDPVKLANVILKLAEYSSPPVSFVAGSDAIEWTQSAIVQKQDELHKWRETSLSTDGEWL